MALFFLIHKRTKMHKWTNMQSEVGTFLDRKIYVKYIERGGGTGASKYRRITR